jgi:hypothetical protein
MHGPSKHPNGNFGTAMARFYPTKIMTKGADSRLVNYVFFIITFAEFSVAPIIIVGDQGRASGSDIHCSL